MKPRIRPKRKLKATAPGAARYANEDLDEEPSMNLSRAFFVVLILHVVAVGGIFAFNSMKNNQEHARTPAAPPAVKKAVASTPSAPVAQAKTTRIHYVRKGETLTRVAALYGTSVKSIEQLNKLAPGATVEAGTELHIPAKTSGENVPLDVRKLVETPRSAPQQLVHRNTKPQASTPAMKALEELATARTGAPKTPAQTPEKPAAAPTATNAAPDATATTDNEDASSTEKPESVSIPSGEIYTVARGDNPASIARKFRVAYADLLKTNGISDPKKLQIGQKLLIPKKRG